MPGKSGRYASADVQECNIVFGFIYRVLAEGAMEAGDEVVVMNSGRDEFWILRELLTSHRHRLLKAMS